MSKLFDEIKFTMWVLENAYYQPNAAFKEYFYLKSDLVRQTQDKPAKSYTIYGLKDIFDRISADGDNCLYTVGLYAALF